MSDFKIIVPETTTNLITNPSAKTATTNYTASGGSIARSTAQACRGYASIAVTPTSGTSDGVYYGTVSLTSGTAYTFSVDVLGVASIPYRIYFASTSGTVLGTAATFTGTGEWQRVEVTYTEVSTTTRRLYVVKNSSSSTGVFYIDGLQLEAKAYSTTYCDGDQVGNRDDGYTWSGTIHASTSTRHAQERSGGRVYDIVTDLGVASIDATGLGVPEETLHTDDLSLLPGVLARNSKVGPRYIDLTLSFQGGSSLSTLHAKRKLFRQAIKRNKVTPEQIFKFRYTGGPNIVEIGAQYAGGLEGKQIQRANEVTGVRLFCPQPYWRGIGNRSAALTVRQSVSNANMILQRSAAGVWSAMGTGGAGNAVYALAVMSNGDIIAAGDTTSFGGVSNTDGIARWNGSSWNAMGTGISGGTNASSALAVMPNGDLIFVGQFTGVSGVSNTDGIARWDGSAWNAMGTGVSSGATEVNALIVMPDGSLIAGGGFTGMGGVASTAGIARWDGSAWGSISSGLSGGGAVINALAVMPNGDLIAGGSFTTINGVAATNIARRSGSTWYAMGTLDTSAVINALAVMPNGDLIAGGSITTAGGATVNNIALWNGAGWSALGSGLDNPANTLAVGPDGTLYVGGGFSLAGGVTVSGGLARWSSGMWSPLSDVVPPGGGGTSVILAHSDGRMIIGNAVTGTAITGVVNTVTYDGTADTRPQFIATGPGRLYSLDNKTVGAAIYFDLTLVSGEIVTLDLDPEQIKFTSNLRGNIIGSILNGSDVSDWRLQEGENSISCFINDASAAAYLVWPELYEAADG